MPSSSDVKRRLKSATNIQQITKAMKMVAAARLHHAQENANNSRPYTEKIRQMLADVAGKTGDVSHPLLAVREVKRVAYLVLSADKGLAGAYSANAIKEALAHVAERRDSTSLLTVGRKATQYFTRRGYQVDHTWIGISERPTYEHAVELARVLAKAYADGEYDEIYITFTHFYSPIHNEPRTVRVLPIETTGSKSDEADAYSEYIFEPSAAEVLKLLLPKYLETLVYGALLQSAASELGARMMAMESATDNAGDLITQLILNYNKIRQATVTNEIAEICGGAEALQ